MTETEKFIHDNPFPKNGEILNSTIVDMIKKTDDPATKGRLAAKLLQVNARLCGLIFKQSPYANELEDVVAFAFDGLLRAAEDFDPAYGRPFYSYATSRIKSMLQSEYNYNHSLVHVPLLRRDEFGLELVEYDEYINIDDKECENLSNASDDRWAFSYALDDLIDEYIEECGLTKRERMFFKCFDLYRSGTPYDEISGIVGVSVHVVQKGVRLVTKKLAAFQKKRKGK